MTLMHVKAFLKKNGMFLLVLNPFFANFPVNMLDSILIFKDNRVREKKEALQ